MHADEKYTILTSVYLACDNLKADMDGYKFCFCVLFVFVTFFPQNSISDCRAYETASFSHHYQDFLSFGIN